MQFQQDRTQDWRIRAFISAKNDCAMSVHGQKEQLSLGKISTRNCHCAKSVKRQLGVSRCEQVWTGVNSCEQVCTSVNSCRQLWTAVYSCEQLWTRVNRCEVWTGLNKSEQLWSTRRWVKRSPNFVYPSTKLLQPYNFQKPLNVRGITRVLLVTQ